MLEIKDLFVKSGDTQILSGLNLSVKKGEIHAIMGPNGAGKSTLAKALAGHPEYECTSGEAYFNGQNLFDLDPEERARLGFFIGFQYPPEIAGVSNTDLLKAAVRAVRAHRQLNPLSDEAFNALLKEKMALLEMPEAFSERAVNEGFSGGEKKRNEIVQMALLEPTLAVLDETDSGLDIDAMRIVASGVKHLMDQEKGLVLITHYQRLLNYIQPDVIHVMMGGKIVLSDDASLSHKLEERGYDWIHEKVT